MDEYMMCDNAISTTEFGVYDTEYCYCAAGFYTCMDEASCVTDDTAEQHSRMCMAHNCTAAECGASEKFNLCNQTNMMCGDEYLNCQKERVDPAVDPCVKNYKKGKGKEFCTLPKFGGQAGCIYDEEKDDCYTSGDCACSKDYFGACRRDVLTKALS